MASLISESAGLPRAAKWVISTPGRDAPRDFATISELSALEILTLSEPTPKVSAFSISKAVTTWRDAPSDSARSSATSAAFRADGLASTPTTTTPLIVSLLRQSRHTTSIGQSKDYPPGARLTVDSAGGS